MNDKIKGIDMSKVKFPNNYSNDEQQKAHQEYQKTYLVEQTVPEIIKSIRVSKNITQTDLADKLGMSQNGYSKVERGLTEITIEKLKEIANALDVHYLELLGKGSGLETNRLIMAEERVEELEKAMQVKEKHYIDTINDNQNRSEKRINDLERIIESQTETILLLKEKIAMLENRK